MAVSLLASLKTTRLTQVKNSNDAGGAATGKLKIYAGSVPANADAALGGATLLATLTALTIGAPSAGSSSVSATSATAVASGTPTFCRFTDSSDNVYLQCSAGVGSGDVNFNASISLGGTVSLSSGTLAEA